MSSHEQIGQRGRSAYRSLEPGLPILRQAEKALNAAISTHGIDSGEALAAKAYFNEIRRQRQELR